MTKTAIDGVLARLPISLPALPKLPFRMPPLPRLPLLPAKAV